MKNDTNHPLCEMMENISDFRSASDLACVMAVGEGERRRLAVAEEAPAACVKEALEKYESFLVELAARLGRGEKIPVPSEEEVRAELDLHLARLGKIAHSPAEARGEIDDFDPLLGVEDALAVAAASARVGTISKEVMHKLAAKAEKEVACLAPRLPELCEFAERRWMRLADPEEIYGFLWQLAKEGPFFTALAEAGSLPSEERRKQIIALVLSKAHGGR